MVYIQYALMNTLGPHHLTQPVRMVYIQYGRRLGICVLPHVSARRRCLLHDDRLQDHRGISGVVGAPAVPAQPQHCGRGRR